MAHDLTTKFYTCLNLPVHEKLTELTKLIDQSSPTKELQALFKQLVSHIFASSFTNGWGLRNITLDSHRYDYEGLLQFLEPQGPMLRLCYKLLSNPQLKYDLPLDVLPLDLQMSLQSTRCPQFYAELLATDPQTMNMSALMLNPFDYYMFNFALHLVSSSQNKSTWENWNSVYFALACDYLLHFLPVDPNVPVLPHIPNYTGKGPMVAPLQNANRPYSPSLLLLPDISVALVNNQHAQTQSRNEVWRSETVLQVFVDIWMSVDQFSGRNIDMFQRSIGSQFSSPERVRTVRVLVKHLHSFSANHLSDSAIRSSTLRKYARQIMCSKGYHYIKHLVTTWPLDASFRLVMELWLSLIQPWRYVNNCISREIIPNNNLEEHISNGLDSSFIQFIAETFPCYTCIFQLVLPRFMRLDLTASKNAVMLFRLGKVFSQPHLVPILSNLEQAIMDSGAGLQPSPDTSFNNSGYEHNSHSYTYDGIALNKWVAVAKQAICEMNLSSNFDYQPIWSENVQHLATEFIRKILNAKAVAEKTVEENIARFNSHHKGLWAGIARWLMLDADNEENAILEESKKVPTYLNNAVHYFCNIFTVNEVSLMPTEPIVEEVSIENSSFGNSTNFALSITNKLRSKPTTISYMGDPDLMPITSHESTILVRMLYQISTKINEVYEQQFINLWSRSDYWGYVAKEVLQKPCRIQTYVKDMANYQNVIRRDLPARLSLRKLGAHAFVVYICIGYFIFRMFSYSGLFYIFVLTTIWMLYVMTRAGLKMMKIM